ncbi:DUF2809 domain-containing protein, partial [Kitasatospora herbaricolor]|uniref:ribosomal maturation YjgA family protein n=1 Tax=Kitasatospora herbaricolor TaxID=68217 RepID=UPI0036D8C538
MSDLRGDAGLVRVRAGAGLAALLTVAAGLGVRAVAGEEPAKYAGDALYTVLLHALVVLLAPRIRPGAAAALALAASWAVEFAQITGVPAELSGRSTLARLVLGSTFNPPDLFWYLVGALFAWSAHLVVRRLARGVRARAGGGGAPRLGGEPPRTPRL